MPQLKQLDITNHITNLRGVGQDDLSLGTVFRCIATRFDRYIHIHPNMRVVDIYHDRTLHILPPFRIAAKYRPVRTSVRAESVY